MGSAPAKATMQLLHQTCRSRIDRLKAAGVTGGSSGKCGAQQRFRASTSSPMSSVRQNLYALKPLHVERVADTDGACDGPNWRPVRIDNRFRRGAR